MRQQLASVLSVLTPGRQSHCRSTLVWCCLYAWLHKLPPGAPLLQAEASSSSVCAVARLVQNSETATKACLQCSRLKDLTVAAAGWIAMKFSTNIYRYTCLKQIEFGELLIFHTVPGALTWSLDSCKGFKINLVGLCQKYTFFLTFLCAAFACCQFIKPFPYCTKMLLNIPFDPGTFFNPTYDFLN